MLRAVSSSTPPAEGDAGAARGLGGAPRVFSRNTISSLWPAFRAVRAPVACAPGLVADRSRTRSHVGELRLELRLTGPGTVSLGKRDGATGAGGCVLRELPVVVRIDPLRAVSWGMPGAR
jgi:hypothetical protein